MVDRTYIEKVKSCNRARYWLNWDREAKGIFIERCLIAIFIDFFGRLQMELEVFCGAANIMITKSVEEQ